MGALQCVAFACTPMFESCVFALDSGGPSMGMIPGGVGGGVSLLRLVYILNV